MVIQFSGNNAPEAYQTKKRHPAKGASVVRAIRRNVHVSIFIGANPTSR